MKRTTRRATREPVRTTKQRRADIPVGNGTPQLLKELWQAAVTLRGSIEPADYKRYVLPVIFLRFLSIRYERRRDELERMVREEGSEYYTRDPKSAKAVINDPDEYRAAGAFIVPAKARWDYIREQAQADNIKVILDDALELLEKTYPDKLRGLLPRIYSGSNLDRESVTGLINLFSKDIFRQDQGGEDLIGRVYEYFIGGFADSEGKRGGEYFTPLSIVRTLVAMLEPDEGIVFDPCCGSGPLDGEESRRSGHIPCMRPALWYCSAMRYAAVRYRPCGSVAYCSPVSIGSGPFRSGDLADVRLVWRSRQATRGSPSR